MKAPVLLVSALLAGWPGTAPAGEIVKRDVYYHTTDSTASQYVFQGEKSRNSRNRSYTRRGLAPRYRPVRTFVNVSYPGCPYYVPPHCGSRVTYRSRGSSTWFYPGGCRTVVRVQSPSAKR